MSTPSAPDGPRRDDPRPDDAGREDTRRDAPGGGMPGGSAGGARQFPSYPQQYSAQPPYPSAGPQAGPQHGWVDGRFAGGQAPQPGVIPLRPMTVGEVLSGAVRVVRGNAGWLMGVAFLGAIISSLVPLFLASLAGPLTFVTSDRWLQEVAAGRRTSFPASWVVHTVSGLVVGVVVQTVLSAVSTAVVTRAVMGRPSRGILAERLRGRWPVLIGVTALVTLGVTLGTILLIIPGVLLYLAWIVAVPVAVMERTNVLTAIRRSTELTRGHRGRIFGTMLAVVGIGIAVTFVIAIVVTGVVRNSGSMSQFVATEVLGVVAGGLLGAWSASVVALIYVDLRIRKENLGPALAAAAQQPQPPNLRKD